MQLQKKSRNRELVYGVNAVEQAIETSPCMGGQRP